MMLMPELIGWLVAVHLVILLLVETSRKAIGKMLLAIYRFFFSPRKK